MALARCKSLLHMFITLYLFSRDTSFWSNFVDKCTTWSRNWICKGQHSTLFLPLNSFVTLSKQCIFIYLSYHSLFFFNFFFFQFFGIISARIVLIWNAFFGPQNCKGLCTLDKCKAPVVVAICAPELSSPYHFLQVYYCYFPFGHKGEDLWVWELQSCSQKL